MLTEKVRIEFDLFHEDDARKYEIFKKQDDLIYAIQSMIEYLKKLAQSEDNDSNIPDNIRLEFWDILESYEVDSIIDDYKEKRTIKHYEKD